MLLEFGVSCVGIRLHKRAGLASVCGRRGEGTWYAQLGTNAFGARATAFRNITAHVGPLYVTALANAPEG